MPSAGKMPPTTTVHLTISLTGTTKSLENREEGIFGLIEPGALPETREEPVELCPLRELRCGPAEIVSDVSGSRESYSARVLRVYPGGGSRDLLIQVTDERLIGLTGGIVQGMSGSPILQDGRLAGEKFSNL